jgi:hypothetical protein
MIEIAALFIKSPTLITLLIIIAIVSIIFIYKLLNRIFSLYEPTFEEVINARTKLLVDGLSERVEALETNREDQEQRIAVLHTSIAALKEENKGLHDDNIKLTMINAILLSNNTMIKGVPYSVFSYPDHKALFLSVEYGNQFLKKDQSIAEYILKYNESVWNTQSAKEGSINNDKAAKGGVWLGFETIFKDGEDLTNDYLIIKFGLKDHNEVVTMIMRIALKITGDTASVYFKELINKYKAHISISDVEEQIIL